MERKVFSSNQINFEVVIKKNGVLDWLSVANTVVLHGGKVTTYIIEENGTKSIDCVGSEIVYQGLKENFGSEHFIEKIENEKRFLILTV